MKNIIDHIKNSPCAHLNKHLYEPLPPKQKSKFPATNRGRKEKAWIALNAGQWAKENNLILSQEVEFAPGRKYRFDWAVEELKVAIEYEGIFSEKSRHTTAKGFTGDTDKYNLAQSLGWRVIRLTAINYKNLWRELEKYKP